MNDLNISSKRAALSPAKRALLERYLRGRTAPKSSIQTIPRSGLIEAPLSFAQQRIWLLCQLDPGSPFYHMAYRVRLAGALDRAALARTLEEMVRRQEILRTVYPLSGENPVQKVLPSAHLPLPVVDISHLAPAEREHELLRLTFEEARQPFDLVAGRPIRVKLITLGHQDHLLLLTLHHIAFDGWSLGVLIREVAHLYPALAQGETPSLPALPIQYTDFAFWQRQELPKERLQRSLKYWLRKLDNLPALQLPTDHPRPGKQSFRGANFSFTLPSGLSQRLKELGLREGVTIFSACLAAFQILLQRYSGQTDIVLGTVVANRDLPETANIIGCLLSTLVIRSHVAPGASCQSFLGQVHREFLEIYEHRDLPFEKLVEELHPERDLSRNPLFQVAVVFHNAPIGDLQLPGLAVTAGEVELGITRFDLTLHLMETAAGLKGWIEYSTELFLEQRIARMAAHWQRLLEGMVADPQARVGELAMLTEAEQRQLAVGNATDAKMPLQSRLHGLVAAQAARLPDAVALVHGDQTLSYAILNQRANQLAHALQQRGAGPEVRVGVCLEPSLEMVIALLGILKANGAYVPVDPSYPPQRQTDILTDSGAALVVTRQCYAAALADCGAELLCLEHQRLAAQPEYNPAVACHPDHAAYLIYTSGSTGRPKGVVVSHRNAVHSTVARLGYYEEPVQGFLLLSSYAFDSSVAGIFWTLTQGGRLCLPSESERRDPLALARLIAAQRVSHLLCLPSLYSLLLEQAESGQLSTLKTVIVAGEACPVQLVAAHYARLPAVRLYNEYGPTEGTVWSSVHAIQAEEGGSSHSVPIGRPIANTQIHLLDAHFNQVPVGVAGELYIGGAGIARGYHGQPALTAERFMPDPFAKEAGRRLYKTGDLARYREEGVIEFLGRLDHQVKIRGYRIELGEIEARLRGHSQVKEAAVLVREDHPGDKRLVAYLVLSDGAQAIQAAAGVLQSLRADLKVYLPEHMVPAAYVVLERLPQTPNGKLDRSALPAPDRSHSMASPQVPPRNATEARLLELWREVLGTEAIGIQDNFFDLGGYSMLAVRLAFRVRETLGVDMPLRGLFEQPTIAAQAQLINGDAGRQALKASPASAIPWEAEAELAPDIIPRATGRPVVASPAAVLLTGATGFLGAFLLRELLRETGAKIYCLVRGNSLPEAAARLGQIQERYELGGIAASPRVIPLRGDLSQPFLGMAPDRFEQLSGEIDVIYHNGAAVDFTAAYETLKPANVLGTQEVLRLACWGQPKAVHYVSTVSVFGEHLPSPPSGFTEEDFPSGNEKLTDGYAQSKWVAERMVRKAAERGLPVTIHRPSTIIGDSASGVWNTGDFLCRMIKGCIELGLAPDMDEPLDVVPVDYVSKAIVFLSSHPDLLGKTFHLTNRRAVSAKMLIDQARALGYPLQSVPVECWVSGVTDHIKHSPDHLLYPLLPIFEEWPESPGDSEKAFQKYDCQSTIEFLASGNIGYPTAMDNLFEASFSYLLRSGFLPPPGKWEPQSAMIKK